MAKRISKPKVFEEMPAPKVARPPKPLTFMVYVRPRPPREKIGSLVTSTRSKNAELATCTVGQILAIGALAWKAGTPDLDPTRDPVAQSLKVGDWIHYRQASGQKLRRVRDVTDFVFDGDVPRDDFILGMSDSDVFGLFDNEAHAAEFADWN